jgi:hypothetical protein
MTEWWYRVVPRKKKESWVSHITNKPVASAETVDSAMIEFRSGIE